MAPIKQRAAFVSESGLTFGLVDVPKPGPGQILVKIVAAAQNPTDWKSLGRVLKAAKYGGIVGNDYAGVVEELGPDVPEGMWTIGERVAGFVLGTVQANGAFSEYLVARAEVEVVPIPDGWSFEEAAQLGVAPLTALQCLHETLELPSPFEARSTAEQPQRTILIWGGASAVGQYAIQFAKLCGLRVLTTASSKNFDLVKGLGVDEVFDYRDEGAVENIRAATGNALDIAIDTISEGKTPAQVTGAIGDKGGKVAIVLPYESPRPTVKVTFSMVPDLIRVRLVRLSLFGTNGKWYVNLFKQILATGKVKPVPVFIQPNGLAGVKDGLQYMQDGKVSAQKLTYRISDTPAV
ncbi:chaperonin 10-like protein [Russula aff. rugulosa BPL654]|nr:chaperonin 10-like protein [Russula aff. rugulosa BPL654]KAI0272191.1 chaperonin 10-like protein [Russula aff. rugulosa BPL654]